MSREWRNLKLWKQAGWGHTPPKEDSAPSGLSMPTPTNGSGSLATFCSTCPQPGINLPDNWQNDPNE